MSYPKPQHRQRGLTLVEAVITLTIAAILFTWAVPSLQDFITRNRMSTEVNYFTASLHFARSEAVKRLKNVRLCPSVDGSACLPTSNNNWHQGWMVFSDDDTIAGFSAGDTVLQLNPALPNRFRARGPNPIIFQSNGQTAVTPGTYIFCDTGGVAERREVILSTVGRLRTQKVPGSCPS